MSLSNSTKQIDSEKAAEFEGRGDEYRAAKKLDEAFEAYQNSCNENPENPNIYDKLLEVKNEMGKENWSEEDFSDTLTWTMKKQELLNPEIQRLHESFTPEYQAVKRLIAQLLMTPAEARSALISKIRTFETKAVQPLLDTFLSLDALARENAPADLMDAKNEKQDFEALIAALSQKAREASRQAAILSTPEKNALLLKMAEALIQNSQRIQMENEKDLLAGKAKLLSSAMIDRLTLNASRIEAMAQGLREVAALPDPVGEITKGYLRPNGLKIEKVRIPLGVIAIIYESRPNVTVDAAGLCLKSGNAVILRGGSEAIHSNQILGEILREVLREQKISEDLIQVVPTTDREAVKILLEQDRFIDLVIPRGGANLMRMVREYSKIPVIRHDQGICHIFVDYNADLEKAERICLNSKVQRPGVCNALETLLVDENIARTFLPRMIAEYQKSGVEIRGCARTQTIVPGISAASEEDWATEYLDLILSVKVVNGLDEAIAHIEKYGSLHTESILTNDEAHAERFLKEVNSSVVLVNASTRFNDGSQLGLGAEIGISTSKLHAFGPMGLEELTTLKYVVRGNGQIRE